MFTCEMFYHSQDLILVVHLDIMGGLQLPVEFMKVAREGLTPSLCRYKAHQILTTVTKQVKRVLRVMAVWGKAKLWGQSGSSHWKMSRQKIDNRYEVEMGNGHNYVCNGKCGRFVLLVYI